MTDGFSKLLHCQVSFAEAFKDFSLYFLLPRCYYGVSSVCGDACWKEVLYFFCFFVVVHAVLGFFVHILFVGCLHI